MKPKSEKLKSNKYLDSITFRQKPSDQLEEQVRQKMEELELIKRMYDNKQETGELR
jgi:hypothetical protein